MRKFDYSFLKNSLLPSSLLGITNSIAELKALDKIRKRDFQTIFTKLESIAKVQSVKGSNAIENIVTTDKRIEEIVNRSSAPLNHNEQEIAGYRDALNAIHNGFENISLDEQSILNLHSILLSFTETNGGNYKTSDNVILEIDSNGNRKIRFTPTKVTETPQAMQQLVYAFMDANSDSGINKLLLIPCFILDFLCIHPFSDGNGRMSRLLSLLLLYKAGFDAGKYISFEEQINKNKNSYYESLRKSSENWESNSNDYLPFIENFIFTLLVCYKELDKRFALIHLKKVSKRERVEQAILNSLLPIGKQEINYILPDISVTTIEVVISQMLKQGRIKKIGTFKDAKYIKN
ncbi:Fic family protein [Fluviicola sp.]|jgi:Fic family protein|uniref:Fic family protein n=1 Tax=Fluviicola sp. TaxID=1917219 RepID=UPI0028320323|nr:Fic family protein [Fluviicola sp.]MDR0802455.1 Fic family protein [Fluviicola sp.]